MIQTIDATTNSQTQHNNTAEVLAISALQIFRADQVQAGAVY